ncbi:hypothetical protein DPEC_G00147200 [Dallia pectoralis]|uniref:Uncharacterized protein n=1 Tax=Dallia pectoralis TaxID=75939 RepID=A0ACC2GIH1_DALPE|nr:hypothetical protein DPEC_G00147200 [Dallia pectoralis]
MIKKAKILRSLPGFLLLRSAQGWLSFRRGGEEERHFQADHPYPVSQCAVPLAWVARLGCWAAGMVLWFYISVSLVLPGCVEGCRVTDPRPAGLPLSLVQRWVPHGEKNRSR